MTIDKTIEILEKIVESYRKLKKKYELEIEYNCVSEALGNQMIKSYSEEIEALDFAISELRKEQGDVQGS